jgi:membrane-associated phospholipid phosphatase
MVGKLIIKVLFLSATLFSIPAYAAALDQAAAENDSVIVKTQIATAPQPGVTSSTDVDKINLKYLGGYFVDTGKILASPLHWEAKDWLKAGMVLGVTSSLFLVDQKVKDFAQDHQSPIASKFAAVGNGLGDGFYALSPVGAAYLYGYLADDHKARRTALLALESFAIAGVMTSGLKMLAERHRPNSGDTPTTWDGPKWGLRNVSFSSGHTASAFSIATVFADQYKDNAYIPPLAYGLATLTGLSRIYSNAHWSSDVFFGGALGYFVSKAVLSFHRDDTVKKQTKLMIMPAISKEMTGITMKYEF